jgi:putative flippase GtrA
MAILRVPDPRRARPDDWAQLVRFCCVGASGYVVNLAVFALLLHGANAHHILAALGSFAVSWSTNFVFNKYWTFKRHELPAHLQALRYLAVSLVALGLGLIALEGLVRAGLDALPSQAIAIALVVPVNFLLNRRWSFR